MKHGEKNFRTNGLGAVEARGNYPRGNGLGPKGDNRTGARKDEKHSAGGEVATKPMTSGGATEQSQ
jgi:hypothetical protein